MNRETYPASLSPIKGDVNAGAGAKTATVVGIQTQAVAPTIPTDKDVLRFNAAVPDWEPTADGNAAVTIGTFATAGGVTTSKGLSISDDRDFSVNNIGINGLVGWSLGFAFDIFVNGVGVL